MSKMNNKDGRLYYKMNLYCNKECSRLNNS